MNPTQKAIRNGNLSSSEIYRITTTASRQMTDEELAAHKAMFPKSKKRTIQDWPGVAATSYIREANMERRLGRCLNNESNARPMVWGNLVEAVAFSKLDFEYELVSQDSIVHNEYDFWCGTPDVTKEDTVGDIKCPMTLKSFCQLVDPIYDGLEGIDAMNRIREEHSDGEKYYWQLVSNSILTKKPYAELIVFMPYQSELADIQRIAAEKDNCEWIWFAQDGDLPYLIEGAYYKNINIIRFEVPEADKQMLTEYMMNAGKLLIQ
jgi:hypothetical protein